MSVGASEQEAWQQTAAPTVAPRRKHALVPVTMGPAHAQVTVGLVSLWLSCRSYGALAAELSDPLMSWRKRFLGDFCLSFVKLLLATL